MGVLCYVYLEIAPIKILALEPLSPQSGARVLLCIIFVVVWVICWCYILLICSTQQRLEQQFAYQVISLVVLFEALRFGTRYLTGTYTGSTIMLSETSKGQGVSSVHLMSCLTSCV